VSLFSEILTLIALILDVLIVVPELHTNFSVRVKLIFTWIFDDTSWKSVLVLLITNIACVLLAVCAAKKKELIQ
jgi:putative exporter of polyketide antibiotics